jgi:hypothetical protein
LFDTLRSVLKDRWAKWTATTTAVRRAIAMTDHNLEKSENKGSICLISSVFGYTLLVFKDCHGYQVDVIAPNGDHYCNGEIFYSALCAETKGRKWIEDLREEDLDLELDPDE